MNRKTRIWYQSASLILAICVLFTACGGGAKGDTKHAMGRYVEKRLEFPLEGRMPSQMLQRTDGSMDVFYMATEEYKDTYRYNTTDGQKWEKERLDWKSVKDRYYGSVAYDGEDNLIVMATEYLESGGVSNFIYRENENAQLEQISIDWRDEKGSPSDSGFIEEMKVAENGDLFFKKYSRSLSQYGIWQYKQDGSFVRFIPAGGGNGKSAVDIRYTLDGGSLYIADSSRSAVIEISTEDGSEVRSVPFDSFGENLVLATEADGALILENRSGIYRLAKGGSTWEKLVDGSLTSLSIPSTFFGSLIAAEDGAYYIIGVSGSTSQLYQYVYDPDIATLPEKELVVYTLHENKALLQAAGEFQRDHPDIRVNVQVGMDGESSATESDMIKALNTELLNGKGPDVILLDGMPVQSYIEKGVLTDLSAVMKELSPEKTMNKTVVETFRNKDGIFAVPSSFSIPVIATAKGGAAGSKSLEELASFAAAHPDKPLVGDKSPERLMELFYPVCAPAWIVDGKVQEKGMSQFLDSVKTISETAAKSYPSYGNGKQQSAGGYSAEDMKKTRDSEDLFHWAFGRAHSYVKVLKGSNSFMDVALAMRQVGDGQLAILPGQADNIYIPEQILGINSSTKEREGAEDYVKLLLSADMQAQVTDMTAFPVSLEAMKQMLAEEDDSVYMGLGGATYDSNESLMGGLPTAEEKKPLLNLWKSVKTPYLVDNALMEMIINEAQGYFTGEKSMDKVISDIKEATQLYLTE